MSCNYSKSEVGEIHDALKSMVGSLLRKGFSVESVAEAFIRQSNILQTAIDDEPARPSYTSHNGSRGYRTQESRPSASYQGQSSYSTYSDHGRDSGYSSSHSSNTGSRGYRTREYRPGGYAHSSYTAPPPSGTKPEEDLYMVLDVSKTASAEQIKSAHRKLCLKHHPDRATSGPYAEKAATELMARINQANDVLKDQKLRAYYDRTGLIAAEL
ncbi:hypothetical protein G6514_000575 [Epicoccum nigrum]|nr:hypothetical protein G6514_000575 [Epicoccum nigrum]